MKLGHRHRPSALIHTEAVERDGGYVLVMFAILLIPVMLLAGFSVDVGHWYNRASDMQKAADAAALAGVVWLPDEDQARSVAIETAAKNGFDNADPDVSVTVSKSTKSPNRLQVSINARVGSFIYSAVGGEDLDMQRTAFAEYVTPVPLGSPENYFGGTDEANSRHRMDIPADKIQNLWGNIHGPYTNNYNGDQFAPRCRGGFTCGTNTNASYRPTGYLYTIEVPEGVSNMSVDIFDAGYYPRSSESDPRQPGDYAYSPTNGSPSTRTTRWTFYDTDSTPLIVTDNMPAAAAGICSAGTAGTWTLSQGEDESTYKNEWQTLCRMSGSVPAGKYLLRVETPDDGAFANRYALRVLTSSTVKPKIAAYGDMSMYNNIAEGTADFYLAEVGPTHQGKIFEVSLYDPGEVSGDAHIDLMRPDGTRARNCELVTTNEVSGGAPARNETLNRCTIQTSNGSAQYNGESIILRIQIPNDYSCIIGRTDSAGCWWKIRYRIDAQATDTTTWSARILGDPVHLIEE